jgi:hypothetical protein
MTTWYRWLAASGVETVKAIAPRGACAAVAVARASHAAVNTSNRRHEVLMVT